MAEMVRSELEGAAFLYILNDKVSVGWSKRRLVLRGIISMRSSRSLLIAHGNQSECSCVPVLGMLQKESLGLF